MNTTSSTGEEEEVASNEMKNSLSSCSSCEELSITRQQHTSSTILGSSTTKSLSLMSSARDIELNDVPLPYPLRLDKDLIHRIGLKVDEFINYCQSNKTQLMFDDPMDVIDNFIQYRLKEGLDMGVNEECLNHLNNVGQIYTNDESLEHYVYDYIEVQIEKLTRLPIFKYPPNK